MTAREMVYEYTLHGLRDIEPADIIWTLCSLRRPIIFNKTDREVFNKLPEKITIYRGCDRRELEETGQPLGISWTTDIDCANFFAYRGHNPYGCVCSTTINKSDIKAYTNDRHESEVLVLLPENSKVISTYEDFKDVDVCKTFHDKNKTTIKFN